MKRTRVIATLVATGVLAGGLTACSAGSEGGDGSDGTVTVSLMVTKQIGIDSAQQQIPGFEAEMKKQGKDIKVELIGDVLTDPQFVTKITQQFIAGEAPDLIDLGDSMVPGFAGAGYLAPLDDYLAEWDGWDHYFPQIKEAMVRQDGKIYALVHDTGVQNFFYRKDLLTEYGVDTTQPETWDDMIARLEEIKAKNGDLPPIVIPAGTAWGGGSWGEGFQPILAGVDQDYYSLETGKWDLQSKGWLPTFNLYSDLVTKDLLPVEDLENPNPWEPTKYDKFPAGKLQVSAQGTWGWKFDWGPDGAAPIADLEASVDTWQYPAMESGGETYGWSGLGSSYGIAEKSENKDAAALLAQYLSSGEPLAHQLVASGAAPVRDDIADIPPFSEEPKLVQAGEDLASSLYVPTGDGSEQIAQAVANATESILQGKASGQQAYDEFVKDATDLLGPTLVK